MSETTKAPTALRAKLLRIRQIMGIDDLEIQLGKITLIEGRNEAGKTSVTEAIKALVEGGNDVTLIRKGAEEGETYVLLDDETTMRQRIRRGGRGGLEVKHPSFGAMKSGERSWLSERIDVVSANPVEFLTAGPDRQMELILESAAFDLPIDDVAAIAADAGMDITVEEREALASWDGLRALQWVRRKIFDERTGVNRSLRDRRGTIEDLSAAVQDAPDPAALAEEIADAEAELKDIETGVQADIDAASKEVREAFTERSRQITSDLADVSAEIARLKERKATLENAREELYDQAADAERAATEQVRGQVAELIGSRRERITTLRGREKAAQRAAGARERLAEAKAGVQSLTNQAEALTDALGRLDAVKADTFNKLPIQGLELRDDGRLYVDDVPLHRLNRARLLEIAFWIAERRARGFGLVVVDNLEALDEEHFNAFVRHARERSDLQYIVTRVSSDPDIPDGELRITNLDESEET